MPARSIAFSSRWRRSSFSERRERTASGTAIPGGGMRLAGCWARASIAFEQSNAISRVMTGFHFICGGSLWRASGYWLVRFLPNLFVHGCFVRPMPERRGTAAVQKLAQFHSPCGMMECRAHKTTPLGDWKLLEIVEIAGVFGVLGVEISDWISFWAAACLHMRSRASVCC